MFTSSRQKFWEEDSVKNLMGINYHKKQYFVADFITTEYVLP
jgi:hypothetical protein